MRFTGAVAGLVLACCGAASADTVVFNNFTNTSGLTINGNAGTTVTSDGTVLRLTHAQPSQAGSAFSTTSINAATFSTFFKFRISNPGGAFDGTSTGADGLVFVVQNVSNSIGTGGGGIGYQGIPNSIGVEFDTWNNGLPGDPDSNHLGIDVGGSVNSVVTTHVSPQFDDQNLWYAWVDYNGTTLEVRTNQTGVRPALPTLAYNINLVSELGSTTAYVGFTSGTGAAWGDHDIVSWQYNDSFSPIGAPLPTSLVAGVSLLGVLGGCRRVRRSGEVK